MGRPPIGKTAMTGAERVRLYRQRLAADKPWTKRDLLRRKRDLLRRLGIDPSGLSDAEVAEGAELARRVSQCDSVPGAGKRRPQAIAKWQAYLQRHAPDAAEVDALAQVKQELAQAKARIAELEAELRDGELEARLAARFAPKRRNPAKPKAEGPPLPPDEERDRQIKSLKTANQNLRQKVRRMERHAEEVQSKKGGMAFQTMSALAKALHPDRKPSDAEWEPLRDKALKLLTAWKSDNRKAAREAPPS